MINIVGLGPRPAAASVPTVSTIGKMASLGIRLAFLLDPWRIRQGPVLSENSSCLLLALLAGNIIRGQEEIRRSAEQWPGSSCVYAHFQGRLAT